MKHLTIDINESEYAWIKDYAECHDISVAKLLGSFCQDLSYSDRRGGSDESDYAHQWAGRQLWDCR